jgi:hypothetical protein
MYNYYKKHGNLDPYYYMENDPAWQNDILHLASAFYKRITETKGAKKPEDENKGK